LGINGENSWDFPSQKKTHTLQGLRLVEVNHHPLDAPQAGVVQRLASLDNLLPVLQYASGDGQLRKLLANGRDGMAATAAHVNEQGALRGRVGLCDRDGPAKVVNARYGHALLDRGHGAHEAAHADRVLLEQLVVAHLRVSVSEGGRDVVDRLRFLAAVFLKVLGQLRVNRIGIFPAS
jgi:hypothetical protein